MRSKCLFRVSFFARRFCKLLRQIFLFYFISTSLFLCWFMSIITPLPYSDYQYTLRFYALFLTHKFIMLRSSAHTSLYPHLPPSSLSNGLAIVQNKTFPNSISLKYVLYENLKVTNAKPLQNSKFGHPVPISTVRQKKREKKVRFMARSWTSYENMGWKKKEWVEEKEGG